MSDGSANRNRAGQAWTLVNMVTEETLVEGISMVDGEGTDLYSNRAKMFGIWARLTCVEFAATKFNANNLYR